MILDTIQELRDELIENIVVVNDGSTDNTSDVLLNAGVVELRLPINRGVGAAVQLGIRYAKASNYQYLLFMDADGQHVARDIWSLAAKMKETKADVIIGNRFHGAHSSIPLIRIIYNKIANMLTLLGKTKVSDSQSGFRLLNRASIDNLELELDDYGVCTEMIWKCRKNNLSVDDAPISVRYTKYSMSKGQNLGKGIKTGYSLIKKL